jgi:hypothetical protein
VLVFEYIRSMNLARFLGGDNSLFYTGFAYVSGVANGHQPYGT